MTLRQALAQGKEKLTQANLPHSNPQLEARVLFCHATGLGWARLITDADQGVPAEQLQTYLDFIDRRADGWPVAYLVGEKEFMGLDFHVEEGILVPRPDTETLVEAALDFLKERDLDQPRVLDVCSGSGCVGIALAWHHLGTRGEGFFATDISPLAVKVTLENAHRHGLGAYQGVQSDLASFYLEEKIPFDLIVSNPPYLTPGETRFRVEEEHWKEPALALDGGEADGLALVRRLVPQASLLLKPQGALMIEAAPDQNEAIQKLFIQEGFIQVQVKKDLAGLDRVWIGHKP